MANKVVENLLDKSNKTVSINNLADNYNIKGLRFLDKKDYENAITCFFQALNYDSNYAHAYSNIGNALLQKGNFEH